MHFGEIIGLVAVAGAFGIPITAILTHHQRKLAEIKASGIQGNNSALLQELESLRTEFKALRDTTTKFNLSFDTQLTRVEERVDRIETDRLRTSYDTASVEGAEPLAMKVGR